MSRSNKFNSLPQPFKISTRVQKKEENWNHQNDNNETQKTDAQWLSDDHKP
jgi:hypothetical protein